MCAPASKTGLNVSITSFVITVPFVQTTLPSTSLAKDNTTNTEEALIEIYNKLRQGEPATLEGATSLLYTRLFEPKRYDLATAGRFKFKKKLSLLDRIAGRVLAEDVKDVDGNVVLSFAKVFKINS